MGPCGCCPPRGRGDPQVGTLTPWVVALGSPRAATPHPLPSPAPCGEVLVPRPRPFVGSAHPGGFLLPCQQGFGAGGGALGAPHPPLLGGRRAPVPVLQGGAAMHHLVFSSTITVKHWGLVGNKKRAFYSSFWGGLEGLRPHPAPLPRALRAPPGQRGLEMPQNSPSLGPQLLGCLGSVRAAPWSRVPVSPCPSLGGCWSPPGPGGGSWGHPAAPFWDQRCPVSASLRSRRPLWFILVRVSASGLVCLFLMFSLSNF